MKKTISIIILAILLVPALLMGCAKTDAASQDATTTAVPALDGGQEAKIVEIPVDEFSNQNHLTRNIDLIQPGSLIVILGSNPTTGYQWGETAVLATAGKDPILSQQSHKFVAPQSSGENLVGAPGKDVWVFDSIKSGSTAISFSYGRPWEGGEKDTWTLTINVTVR